VTDKPVSEQSRLIVLTGWSQFSAWHLVLASENRKNIGFSQRPSASTATKAAYSRKAPMFLMAGVTGTELLRTTGRKQSSIPRTKCANGIAFIWLALYTSSRLVNGLFADSLSPSEFRER